MTTPEKKSLVLQNVGAIDRLMRLVLGAGILAWAYSLSGGEVLAPAWVTYLHAIALYPIFTGMLGWDPVYALLGSRTCSDDGRHACGSLPYQVKALFRRAPRYCDTDAERSLEACHSEAGAHPRHKVWRVDVEPVLYPDDKAWHRFFRRHGAGRR